MREQVYLYFVSNEQKNERDNSSIIFLWHVNFPFAESLVGIPTTVLITEDIPFNAEEPHGHLWWWRLYIDEHETDLDAEIGLLKRRVSKVLRDEGMTHAEIRECALELDHCTYRSII